MEGGEIITVAALQKLIGAGLEEKLPGWYLVAGEIAEISVNRSGHCYMTLVDREADSDGGFARKVTAKIQTTIWANTYRVIRPFFEGVTGDTFREGMSVLVKGRVQYSSLYGLSFNIVDIDPTYTVGAAELERQKTIDRLKSEGLLELNGDLQLAIVPNRLAIISAAGAAGYGDFMEHLQENGYGFRFKTTLFESPMQGAEAPAGVISALERIYERADEFDAVLILRGGGSAFDLSCFDDYEMAANIAQFPLPVLTAIGHDRDFHVADMVAYMYVKTPTALADWFVDHFCRLDNNIDSLASRLLMAVKGKRAERISEIESCRMRIATAVDSKVQVQRKRIEMLQYVIDRMNPIAILEQGYSLPLKNGRRLTSISNLTKGDHITLLLRDGAVECEVLNKK